MKRIWIWAVLIALLLTGCSKAAISHPEWEESWVRIGDTLAVEPVEGFTLNESNDVLSVAGLYYATWTCGDGREFVNADGKDATVYDAQIYVLLKECSAAEDARKEVEAWIEREKASYETGQAEEKTFADQKFTVLPLISGQKTNPYGHGIAAFAVRGTDAVSVELVCSERFAGDPQAVLTQFLNGFHYGE